MIIHNIEFLEEDAEFFSDGSVHDATLAQDTIVQGIPCAGNRSVVFYPSGQLKLCWLSIITILNDIPCENNLIYLHENGQLWNVSLAVDRQINKVLHSSGSRLTFDETGELLEHSQFLDRDQWIEGLPCSSQFVVWRYASGRPSVIVLSSSHVINREEYPRGTRIFLDEDGEIIDRQLLNLDLAHRYKQQISGVFEINWS